MVLTSARRCAIRAGAWIDSRGFERAHVSSRVVLWRSRGKMHWQEAQHHGECKDSDCLLLPLSVSLVVLVQHEPARRLATLLPRLSGPPSRSSWHGCGSRRASGPATNITSMRQKLSRARARMEHAATMALATAIPPEAAGSCLARSMCTLAQRGRTWRLSARALPREGGRGGVREKRGYYLRAGDTPRVSTLL